MIHDLLDTAKGFADGIAITIATYIISPPGQKVRNTVIIGSLHAVLHGTACSYHHANEQKSHNKILNRDPNWDPILDGKRKEPSRPVRIAMPPQHQAPKVAIGSVIRPVSTNHHVLGRPMSGIWGGFGGPFAGNKPRHVLY